MATGDEVRREALRLVNAGRVAVGVARLEDLPQGIRDDGGACPIANALADVAKAIGAEFVNVDIEHAEFYAGADRPLLAEAAEKMAALAAAWGGVYWDVQPDEADVSLPDEIRDFIPAFDAGEYPDLDLGGVRP